MKVVIYVIIFCVLSFYSALSYALPVQDAYRFFIKPLSAGLPDIAYTQAVGICVFLSCIRGVSAGSDKLKAEFIDETRTIQHIGLLLAAPWLLLLFVHLVSRFI